MFKIILTLILWSFWAVAEVPLMAVLSGTQTTSTGDPTDLNQSTAYSIKWSQSDFDSDYFDHSTTSYSNQLKILTAGDYRLHFTMPLNLEDAVSVRRSVLAEVLVNGSPIETGRMNSGYIRQASNHSESSLHGTILLNGLSPNDKIEVSVVQDTNQTGKVSTPGAQLVVEYMEPSRTIFSATATETTNSTNLNQATEYALEWTSVVKDTGFTHSNSTNPETITLDSAGDYMVFLNIPLENTVCTNRNNVIARVKIEGTTVEGGIAAQSYIRCLDDHDSSSLHWSGVISGVGAAEDLTVTVRNETSNTENVIVPTSRKASIHIEEVTTTDTISLSGTTLLAGNEWNTSPGSEIQWTNENFKDATVFTHSTSTDSQDITINEDGNYLVVFNSHLTSTVQRANPTIRIRLNSSPISQGQCKTHYIRSQENHNDASCSLTYLIEGMSSGDIISIESIAEALTGAVNDSSPAILTIKKVSDAAPPAPASIVDAVPDKVLHVDAQSLSDVLDESNRLASDTSFSGNVATWKDKSGSTTIHNLVQTSAASRPTYDDVNNFITFDGVNDHFDVADHADLNLATSLKERTIVVAFKTGSDVTSPQVIYEEGGTIRGMNVYIRAGNLYIAIWNLNNDGDGSQPFTSASTAVAADTHYYATLVLDYSNYTGPTGPDGELRGHINGVEFTSLGTTTSMLYAHSGDIGFGAKINDTYYDTGASSGDGDYFEGDLFEFILYNHAIDNTEAIDFYDYMSDRWPDPQPATNLSLTSQYTTDNTQTPNFTWTASISPDVTHYLAALGSTPGGNDIEDWASVGLVTSANLTSLSLSECVNYYVSLKAVDSDTNESTEETTDFLRYDGTDPSDPSGLALSGGSSSSVSKVLSWNGSVDSCAFSHYEAAIGTTSGGSDVVTWTDVGNVNSHQFTGLSLSGATDYYTSIRAYDAAGNVSNTVTSASWQVDTCVASDTTDPTDPTTMTITGDGGPTTTPSHSWQASTDACGMSHYEISVGTSAGAQDVIGWTDIGNVTNHKIFDISPSMSTNTDYYTNVRAVDLAGNNSATLSSASWQLPTPGNVSSGLVLWFDSSDTGTLFSNAGCTTPITDGGSIQCWQDKSTEANHGSASGGATPTWQDGEFNSAPVVRFDGTDDAIDFTSAITDVRTVFIVNKSDTTNHQQILGHTSNQDFYSASNVLIHPTLSNSLLRTANWRIDQSDVASPTITTQTGSYSMISVVVGGNVSADHISSDRKTGGRFFDGDVAEVIIYDRALDSTEIADVEQYLDEKWFTAAPAPVTSLTLSEQYSQISSQSPSFSWTHSTSSDVAYYEVALGTSPGANDVAGWINMGLSNSYQFLGLSLSSCIDYYASVRSVDNDSFVSSVESTTALRFDGTNPADPSNLNLSDNASATQSQQLSWSAGSDSCDFYGYEVALGTTSGGNDVIDWTDVGDTSDHQFTGISPDLTGGQDYFMSVRSKDAAGNVSTGVSSAAFQVAGCIASDTTDPTDPSSLNTSGSATLTKSVELSWSASSDACAFSHYEVAVGTTSGGTQILGYTNVGNVTTYQATGLSLSYGTNYYISVRSVDQAGNDSATVSSSSWQLATPGGVDPTGLEIWYDANDFSTLYSNAACSTSLTGNGEDQLVACIADKSGNDNHATNTPSYQLPAYKGSDFNDLPSLYFDGSTDEFLDFTAVTDIRTVFWVLKEDSSNPGNSPTILGWPAGGTRPFARDSTLGPIFSSTNAAAAVTGGTLQLNGVVVSGTSENMPTSEAVLSLVTTGNVTASSIMRDQTACCSNQTFGGSLAEVIVFSRALNSTEIQDIEAELLLKWSIATGDTTWTGSTDTDWFDPANWSNGVPNSTKDCLISDVANDPVIASGTGICRNITISSGGVTMTNATGANLEIYGNFSNSGSFTQNDGSLILRDNGSSATTQSINSTVTLESLSFNKTAGGTVKMSSDLTLNGMTMPSGSNFQFQVGNGRTLTLEGGLTQQAGTFYILSGGTVEVGTSQTIAVSGGTFRMSGTYDTYPQNTANKSTITRSGAGRWSFQATGGVVNLNAFLIDYLDVNGLQINGTADLVKLDGGQFTNLLADFSTPVKVIQLNTSTAILESIAASVGFNWSAANSTYSGTPNPAIDDFYLVYAPNCNNAALIFDQWFGDFYQNIGTNTEDKIFDNEDGANTCQVSMDISASPVNLLSFDASGYDEAVELAWETGAETHHLGFNVYRSDHLYADYVQINNELIRNFRNSTTFRGSYRFVDEGLNNGQVYYYMIEDIGSDGSSKLHGPISALPHAAAGSVPASSDPESNELENSNPGTDDLGDGAEVIARINGTFRIEIQPPTAVMSTSAWNASYTEVSMAGYQWTTEPGRPQLLERKILVEVDESFDSIDVEVVDLQSSTLTNDLIVPAPNWTADSDGDLQPSYAEDASAYSSSQFDPIAFYQVLAEPLQLQGKTYVQILVWPLRYRATSTETLRLNRLVLDIGIKGDVWQSDAPTDVELPPTAVNGGVRLRYTESSMKSLSFEDLIDANAEGPLDGVPTADLRLYYHGTEQPIEVISVDSFFNSGDHIRFYAPFESSIDDIYDEVVLTQYDFTGDVPLRIYEADNQPAFSPIASPQHRRSTLAMEENERALFDIPLGSLIDRFYWKRIFTAGGATPDSNSRMFIEYDLDDFALYPSGNVEITVDLRGRPVVSKNPTHHLQLSINGSATQSLSFTGTEPQELRFKVSPSEFSIGTNNLELEVLGDMVDSGDYDLVDINRVIIDYPADFYTDTDRIEITDSIANQQINVSGFSDADVVAYDLTDPLDSFRYTNLVLNQIDPGNWNVGFDAIQGEEGRAGQHLAILHSHEFDSIDQILTTRSRGDNLKTISGAPMILLGPEELLDVTDAYVAHRASQGIDVVRVTPEQVYAQFSHGRVSAAGLREFIQFAASQWSTPARYLMIVGDSTFDPNDFLGNQRTDEPLPAPVLEGQHLDFSSDNWLATSENSYYPQLAVGRLPSSDSGTLKDTLDKIMDYENGARAPSNANASVYLTGEDQVNEGFKLQSQQLATSLKTQSPKFNVSSHHRVDHSTDEDMTETVKDVFEGSPLMITYLGHGAENIWGDSAGFDIADASSLQNQGLPVVVALNCLNAYFYDPDPSARSLAETLVLNPNGGAIAFWGSTTMTSPLSQINLATSLSTTVAQKSSVVNGQTRLGDLTLQSLHEQPELEHSRDVLFSYTLIGDPALLLPANFHDAAAAVTPTPPVQVTPGQPSAPVTPPPTIEEPQAPSAPARRSSGSSGGGGGGCVAFADAGYPRPAFSYQFFDLPFLLLIIWMASKLLKLRNKDT